jgi:import inner membrane translocase subunit TIM54
VAEDVRLRRREDSGLDRESDVTKALPTYKPLPERRQRELDGGIVLVGRPTLKEFMAGFKRGWTSGLEKVDREEELARALEDTHFDELPEEPVGLSNLGDSPLSFENPSTSIIPSAHYSPISTLTTRVSTKPQGASEALVTSEYTLPPSVIPPQPPLLLVPFVNYIGFKQIPLMIWDFFNRRHQVRSGAEAGYNLVMAVSRPLHVPDPVENLQESNSNDDTSRHFPILRGDLDFDKRIELYYNKSTYSIPADIEKARQKYYEALPKKLATARELARGIRELTKDEINNPPPTEVELRAERLKKEQRWRDDVEGWDIVRPSSDVVWDEKFLGAFHIFVDPPENVEGADESLP